MAASSEVIDLLSSDSEEERDEPAPGLYASAAVEEKFKQDIDPDQVESLARHFYRMMFPRSNQYNILDLLDEMNGKTQDQDEYAGMERINKLIKFCRAWGKKQRVPISKAATTYMMCAWLGVNALRLTRTENSPQKFDSLIETICLPLNELQNRYPISSPAVKPLLLSCAIVIMESSLLLGVHTESSKGCEVLAQKGGAFAVLAAQAMDFVVNPSDCGRGTLQAFVRILVLLWQIPETIESVPSLGTDDHKAALEIVLGRVGIRLLIDVLDNLISCSHDEKHVERSTLCPVDLYLVDAPHRLLLFVKSRMQIFVSQFIPKDIPGKIEALRIMVEAYATGRRINFNTRTFKDATSTGTSMVRETQHSGMLIGLQSSQGPSAAKVTTSCGAPKPSIASIFSDATCFKAWATFSQKHDVSVRQTDPSNLGSRYQHRFRQIPHIIQATEDLKKSAQHLDQLYKRTPPHSEDVLPRPFQVERPLAKRAKAQ
mmetsp:Transcript_3063/g.5182  ORF Transcript_3063/g.5182 Transcript_3063/m.5182 type:complete len:486 (+) Transcript_3063:224-1681(+)